MGHESPIEPWLAPDHRSACWFQNGLASSRSSDENRWERKPKQLGHGCAANRVHGAEGQNTSCSITRAGKQEKYPAAGEVFFLDFPFYRTYQALSDFAIRVGSLLDYLRVCRPFILYPAKPREAGFYWRVVKISASAIISPSKPSTVVRQREFSRKVTSCAADRRSDSEKRGT